jgi:plastocyanin
MAGLLGTWVAFAPAHLAHPSLAPTYPSHAFASSLIRGRVTIAYVPPVEARPHAGELGMARGRDAADRRRSIVYLEQAPRGAFEDLAGSRARINQINEQFVPRVLAITIGTTVDFPNSDRIYHNVFSLSKPTAFDLGRYAAGSSRAVRFDRPGIVRVFCDIHSHMSAWILVFNHPYFATTDEEGRYQIPNVPPGPYSLAVWHEALPRETRRITIPEGGGAVDVDFALGR